MSRVVNGVDLCLVVDVSSAQGVIDANAAKAAGIDGIIVKATQGADYVNPYRIQQVTAAVAAGLACAEYHFLDGSASGASQASYFLAVARNPRLLDAEAYPPSNPTYQQYLDFHGYMHRRGVATVHTYTGSWWWGNAAGWGYPARAGSWGDPPGCQCGGSGAIWPSTYVTGAGSIDSLLAKVSPLVPLWWGARMGNWTSCRFRQFTSSAAVPGIGALVDLSVFVGTRVELDAFLAGTVPAPPPPIPQPILESNVDYVLNVGDGALRGKAFLLRAGQPPVQIDQDITTNQLLAAGAKPVTCSTNFVTSLGA